MSLSSSKDSLIKFSKISRRASMSSSVCFASAVFIAAIIPADIFRIDLAAFFCALAASLFSSFSILSEALSCSSLASCWSCSGFSMSSGFLASLLFCSISLRSFFFSSSSFFKASCSFLSSSLAFFCSSVKGLSLPSGCFSVFSASFSCFSANLFKSSAVFSTFCCTCNCLKSCKARSSSLSKFLSAFFVF